MSRRFFYLFVLAVGSCLLSCDEINAQQTVSQCVTPVYRVLVTPLKTFTDVFTNSSGTYYTGFNIDVLFAIAKRANFSFTIGTTPNSAFGSSSGQVSTSGETCFGSNSGVSIFQQQQYDIYAVALDQVSEYLTAVDFTTPIFRSDVQILYNVQAGLNNNTKYSVISQTAGKDVLIMTKNPRLMAIWANIQANAPTSLPQTYDDAINLIKNQGYAFVGRTPLIDQEVCNSYYQIAKDPTIFKQTYASFAVQKGNNDLLDKINRAILSLQEDNTIPTLLTKWFPCSNFQCS
ncbi:glutamine-binding periplasmic protein-like [Paramacrobiotus metropolitanus]|uniref:glutamine-binding periplasmic protein-like n=1 Tax=Paramacrobiotus metropolitanus TaxID=2943436 RepID=UPI0024464D5A|nr:glutamine-binding periplasmic protein-like [Paramacrobiotus metropolitanus]